MVWRRDEQAHAPEGSEDVGVSKARRPPLRRLHARISHSAPGCGLRGIFGVKPILRGRRLAVEHVLGMLAAGDSAETILGGYPWLEAEDIQACLLYARKLVGHESVSGFSAPLAVHARAPQEKSRPRHDRHHWDEEPTTAIRRQPAVECHAPEVLPGFRSLYLSGGGVRRPALRRPRSPCGAAPGRAPGARLRAPRRPDLLARASPQTHEARSVMPRSASPRSRIVARIHS